MAETRLEVFNPAKGLMLYDTTTSSFWFYNGLGWNQLSASNSTWNLTGNTAINPAQNFIGTTDNLPLRFRINNSPAGELNPITGNVYLIVKYMNLQTGENTVRDIEFKDEWKIGENYCQLYTMANAEFVPPLCGSRINYDKYSTDKTKFSVGFASPIGQLLSCNHIYSQYVFIDDVQKTIQKLESKRLWLQSLSA